MNKQFDSHTAAAAARETEAGRLFSEIGLSATFFDSMPNEIVIVGNNGEVLASNDRFRNEFGNVAGFLWKEFLLNDRDQIEQDLALVFNRGSHDFEVYYQHTEDSPLEFHIDALKLNGSTPRAALIHRPPFHKRSGFWPPETKQAPPDSGGPDTKREYYRRYEKLDSAVISIDNGNGISFVNASAEALLGSSADRLAGKQIKDLLFQDNDLFDTRVISLGENLLKRPDGSAFWLEVQELPGFQDEKLLILSDISARKSKETELRNAFELYRTLVSQSDYEVFEFKLSKALPIDLDTEKAADLILNSAHLASITGSQCEKTEEESEKQQVGTTFGNFFVKRDTSLEIARNFVECNYQLFKKEIVETAKEGHESFYNTNLVGVVTEGELLRILLSRRDITIRKQAEKAYLLAEDQLRQSQKIEPIGRLAGGIAHDFNNFLAVIMLQIEMMNQELDETSPLRRRVTEIKSVTDKAANMVKQLLAFGRKQTMQPHHVILNEVVEEFIKMTGSLIGEDIEIELILDHDIGVCFVDPNQITQILMNLAINSRDAMPGGGKLSITTKNLLIDENTFKHRAQPKGAYIELSVEDTGNGMEPATKKHIFEPFFTTKESHKGTGLGLATVYGIVKQSKGFIWVDSEVNEGTRFRVQFPRTDSPATVIRPERPTSIPRGTETILLVEDELQIRETSVEVLKSLGYTILTSGDGEEAAEIASRYEGHIHLLLTDVVMPKMNGRELAKKVKTFHPELTVLFMSGYADDIITRHGILEEDVHFLGKPFSPLTLAVKVREALGSLGE